MQVFLSKPNSLTSEQREFCDRLCDQLRQRDMEPRTVGDTVLTGKAPWTKVEEEMRAAMGCVVLGLSQLHIREAVLKEGTLKETVIRDRWSPSAWNQIEASMAKMLRLPLMIIREDNVQDIGVLQWGVIPDRQVLVATDPLADWLNSKQFLQPFNEWAVDVARFRPPGDGAQ